MNPEKLTKNIKQDLEQKLQKHKKAVEKDLAALDMIEKYIKTKKAEQQEPQAEEGTKLEGEEQQPEPQEAPAEQKPEAEVSEAKKDEVEERKSKKIPEEVEKEKVYKTPIEELKEKLKPGDLFYYSNPFMDINKGDNYYLRRVVEFKTKENGQEVMVYPSPYMTQLLESPGDDMPILTLQEFIDKFGTDIHNKKIEEQMKLEEKNRRYLARREKEKERITSEEKPGIEILRKVLRKIPIEQTISEVKEVEKIEPEVKEEEKQPETAEEQRPEEILEQPAPEPIQEPEIQKPSEVAYKKDEEEVTRQEKDKESAARLILDYANTIMLLEREFEKSLDDEKKQMIRAKIDHQKNISRNIISEYQNTYNLSFDSASKDLRSLVEDLKSQEIKQKNIEKKKPGKEIEKEQAEILETPEIPEEWVGAENKDIKEAREEMLADLEDHGRLKVILDAAKKEYLAHKKDVNAKKRYEQAAAEYVAANVNERLNEVIQESIILEAGLDTRAKRIAAKLEQMWQVIEGLNLYDRTKIGKFLEKWEAKNKIAKGAKWATKFSLKHILSAKTGISVAFFGAGFLTFGGVSGFFAAVKSGQLAALGLISARRTIAGSLAGLGIFARGERKGVVKSEHKIQEIKILVEQNKLSTQNDKNLGKLIAEYQYAARLKGLNLDNDDIFKQLVNYRLEKMGEQIEKVENNLGDLSDYLRIEIEKSDDNLDKKLASQGRKRMLRAGVAATIGGVIGSGYVGKAFGFATQTELGQKAIEKTAKIAGHIHGLRNMFGEPTLSAVDEYGVPIDYFPESMPAEVELEGSPVTEEFKFEKPIPETILDEKVGEYPRVVDEEFIKQEAQKSFEQKYGAAGVTETTTEVKPKIAEVYDGQIQDAAIKAGNNEGPTYAILRQLKAAPEKYGLDLNTSDKEFILKAREIAIKNDLIEVDKAGKIISETRSYGGDSYILNQDLKVEKIMPPGSTYIETDTSKFDYSAKPLTSEVLEPTPVKPEIPLKQELPEFAPSEATANQHIITNLEHRFENPEQYIGTGRNINWVENNAVNTLENYLTQKDLTNLENFQELQKNLARLDNTEILERLAQSENHILSHAAEDAKTELLQKGTTIERINNYLELKTPDQKGLNFLQDIFKETVEKRLSFADDKGMISNLFSQRITQSPEEFKNFFGSGAVTEDKIQGAWQKFLVDAESKQLPVKEVWQPRTEIIPLGQGRVKEVIFNVKPQDHLNRATDYLIDYGDAHEVQTISAQELNNKIMGVSEKVKIEPSIDEPKILTDQDFKELGESPEGTTMHLDKEGKPVFEQPKEMPDLDEKPVAPVSEVEPPSSAKEISQAGHLEQTTKNTIQKLLDLKQEEFDNWYISLRSWFDELGFKSEDSVRKALKKIAKVPFEQEELAKLSQGENDLLYEFIKTSWGSSGNPGEH